MVIQSATLRKLQKLGLQSSNYAMALDYLMGGDKLMTQLSDHLEITTAATTGLVDSLETRELVARKHGTEDRRAVIVTITKKGRDLLHE